jgi:4-amino-4-deoxy-L-arabinose transferase-like glycosyltransferase
MTRWVLGYLLVLAAATGLRVADLGHASLDFDEYLHVLPAVAWRTQGQPVLPSGEPYRRALPYTWIVRETTRWTGDSEASVRWPSAAMGVLLVGLVGAFAARWWGLSAGLAAMLLMALDPYMIQMSRVCRMYVPFHAAYLLGAWALYEAWEGRQRGPWRAAWLLLALAALLLAWRLHKLWIEISLSVAAYLVWQALRRRGPRAWLMLGLGVCGALLAWWLGWVEPRAMWQQLNNAPEYAAPWRYDYGYYLRAFGRVNPLLLVSVVPALWWGVRRQPLRGSYLTCLIGVPFLAHALIFDFKEVRYLLHIVPFMAVAVGAAWAGGIASLAAHPRGRAALAAALVVVYGLLSVPQARALQGLDGDVASWREAYAAVGSRVTAQEALIVSVPLVSHYYLKRAPDYVMLNVLIKDAGRQAARNAEGWYLDWYSGRPLITTAEEIEQVFARHPSGWIIVDAARYPHETCVPATVRAVIARQARPWPSPDPSVLIFRWGGEPS